MMGGLSGESLVMLPPDSKRKLVFAQRLIQEAILAVFGGNGLAILQINFSSDAGVMLNRFVPHLPSQLNGDFRHMILPQYIQPLKMAEKNTILSGKLPLSAFPRLADMLTHQTNEVKIELRLGRDDEYIAYLIGTLEVSLPLICQRCWKTVDYDLALPISLSPVLSEAAGKKLPDRYEPLVLQEDYLLLAEMIEEELLLGLPMVPKHAQSDCQTSTN
jgi:uncharacterized protein